ncbi:MAG: L-serine ammonia-lyase, iron-sulfur-dependent, subunit alpha [Phycisphaerales bacterium]
MNPSIFNDVIGPVMRGPSSSHCAAALRLGRLARNLLEGDIEHVFIQFDRHGSLATTHESQGSDMGLFGGLLGWEATDERLPDSAQAMRAAGVTVKMEIGDFGFEHPNTYRVELQNARDRHVLTGISTGGGMIEVVDIDGISLSLFGDFWETLVWMAGRPGEEGDRLVGRINADDVLLHECGDGVLLQVKAQRALDDGEIGHLYAGGKVRQVRRLAPVLPVLSRREMSVPFSTCQEMLHYDLGRNLPSWELAVQYESQRGNLSREEVIQRMIQIVQVVRVSLQQGLRGTTYRDRILGSQCGRFQDCLQAGGLLDVGLLNAAIRNATALMEVKSAMGVIVAAPTAGACAALPGTCLAVADALGMGDAEAAKAMLAAGLIGVLVAFRTTFAAEVCGCQAECGVASGMTAAALTSLAGGGIRQAVDAASMAFQNSLGMICDPVANRVEVPCLGRNVMAAANALACANMALAGYDPVIPLDEVIETMDQVGRSLPRELRCTALGGLSVTRTSKEIETRLQHPAG